MSQSPPVPSQGRCSCYGRVSGGVEGSVDEGALVCADAGMHLGDSGHERWVQDSASSLRVWYVILVFQRMQSVERFTCHSVHVPLLQVNSSGT